MSRCRKRTAENPSSNTFTGKNDDFERAVLTGRMNGRRDRVRQRLTYLQSLKSASSSRATKMTTPQDCRLKRRVEASDGRCLRQTGHMRRTDAALMFCLNRHLNLPLCPINFEFMSRNCLPPLRPQLNSIIIITVIKKCPNRVANPYYREEHTCIQHPYIKLIFRKAFHSQGQ